MILVFGIIVVGAVLITLPELFADSSQSLNAKEMLTNLQSRYTILEGEMNKMRLDLATANKQVVYAHEKETEFVAKIFEQRKEIDVKTQEFTRAAENNKGLQERIFQMEKVEEMMRRAHDKTLAEVKLLKEENELLRRELALTGVVHGKRKKINETVAS